MNDRTKERVELETKLGFLEHTVDALNGVVLEQTREIEQLLRRVTELEKRIASRGGGGEGEEVDPLSERPPHY